MKCTKGNVDLGHFWYTNFWVTDPQADWIQNPALTPPPPPKGLTGFGIENTDALVPDGGVHCLWFAFVRFLIGPHPPPPPPPTHPV